MLEEWFKVLFENGITLSPFIRPFVSLSSGYPYEAGAKFQIMYVAFFFLLISCATYIIRHIYYNGFKGFLKSSLISVLIFAVYSLIMEYVWRMG
jgi:hypothetical protein